LSGTVLAISSIAALWLSLARDYAGSFDFPPSDFTIMDSEDTRMIGHGHYEVTFDGKGYATAFGEDRFNNGEYDIERDKLELRGEDHIPRLITFEHTFFNADGTLRRLNKANFQTGPASCIQYKDGQPMVHSRVLHFPPDTFAGAAIVIPLKGDLLREREELVILHDFNCIPGPGILKLGQICSGLLNESISQAKWFKLTSSLISAG
jgi:hypothetical protein